MQVAHGEMNNSNVLVLGGTGLLGSAFVRFFERNDIYAQSLARSDAHINCDLANKKDFLDILNDYNPSVIVNCAALVDLNRCEESPQASWDINVAPLFTVAEWIRDRPTKLIHISTDHFYDYGGNGPHNETDPIVFNNNYAKHKFCAEKIALEIPKSLVLRTSIIGKVSRPGGAGFWEWAKGIVENDRSATLFTDAFTSSIDVDSFSKFAYGLAKMKATGLINLAASEVYSKKDFVVTLSNILNKNLNNVIDGSVSSLHVKRASCLGLDVSFAEQLLDTKLPTLFEVVERLIVEDKELNYENSSDSS